MDFLSKSGDRLLTGVVLIVFATILLLSGLGFFDEYLLGQELDILASFLLLIIGSAMVFSEANKHGYYHDHDKISVKVVHDD